MSADRWTRVMGMISPAEPDNLDDLLGPFDPRRGDQGAAIFPETIEDVALPVPLASEETVCFGARVTAETPDPVRLAMTLAQMAAEKGAEPIILSHVDVCGLERFGFRVERIAGATPEARDVAEAQAVRFWNIVLVI